MSDVYRTFDLFGQERDSLTPVFRVMNDDADVLKARDLSGWTFSSTIRSGADGNSPAAPGNFNVFAIDAKNGLVRAVLPKNHLIAAGTYYYEIDGEHEGMSETLLEGKLEITASVFQ